METEGAATWHDPVWRDAALTWATDRLAELGHELTGAPEQPHVRPWSTVFRLPTSRGDVWLKAVGPGSAQEPALAVALARWAPRQVLTPLAADPGRRLLLLPDGRSTLRATGGSHLPEAWEALLADHARLQVATAGHAAELLGLGVPDLRPEQLPGQVERLLGDDAAMRTGTPDALPAGTLADLRSGLPGYRELCARLAGSAVPATVQHDDLHDANVFVVDNGYRFFDWGDAGLAHPFLSLLVPLRCAVRTFGVPAGHPVLLRLRDAYLRPWRDVADRRELEELVEVALRVAPLARALTWHRVLSGVHADERAEWAGSVPGWAGEQLAPSPLEPAAA